MNRIYTCYNCGFVWKCDEDHIPAVCPTCGLGPEVYLSEPGEDVSKRRIHVDPPQPIPDWDRFNTKYHPPATFRPTPGTAASGTSSSAIRKQRS